MKNWGVKREKMIFLKTEHKRWQFSLHRYIDDKSNKNIYMFIYKKGFKKCLLLFNKPFSNYEATYWKKLYLLFEKSGNFFFTELA